MAGSVIDSMVSVIGMQDLPWNKYLDRLHHGKIMATHCKKFSRLMLAGMVIFQTERGIYLSTESYIKTMLVKLNMEDAIGLRVRTLIRKLIEDPSALNKNSAEFFMSAMGMLGWLASIGRPDVKYAHGRISQHMSSRQGALDAVIYAAKYCTSTLTASLHQPPGDV